MKAVGIDLGTTNTALSWIDLDARPRRIETMAIPQLVAPGEMGRRPTLPSLLYLPGEHDLPSGATALPWDKAAKFAVGELARVQGALVPGRLVASAKSWLCHPGVDRHAAILPWAAPPEVERRSPVDVSAAYLAHLAAAWSEGTGESLSSSDVVLTVPASFDEVARELTVEAAKRAGLERLTLLEEPQAAFYSWLADHGEALQTQLAGGETVLVCDIGGGTTDFTVIAVEKGDDGLAFRRTAVGDHLLLGGDNMDLALARRVEKKLAATAGKLDASRFQALLQACRTAKEKLLAADGKSSWTLHLAGRGRGLIGGAISTELTRAEVEEAVLDGFFPRVDAGAQPAAARAAGLREFGLPYANDPSVTAHLAAFLRRHGARPDAVLFNGGVLAAPAVRDRIVDVLEAWHGRRPTVLDNAAPDLAVARGAAYFALVRRGEGVRIAAGAARAYYVEVDASTAKERGTVTAVCIAPRGEIEGGEVRIEGREFELLTNRPVRFRLFSSSDRGDAAGVVVTLPDGELAELPPIVTVLRFARSSQDVALKVRLEARRTELGTLDLQLVSPSGDHWKLAFDLRSSEQAKAVPEPDPDPVPDPDLPPATIDAAVAIIRRSFDKSAADPIAPAQTMKQLAATLGDDKSAWPTSALRKLWEPLKELRGQRGRTAEHEARWLNLVGYCLRPGYGVSLDDWRVKEAWRIFNAGLVNDKDNRCRLEWWILWRRLSGGLTRTMQDELGKRIFPHFLPDKKKTAGKSPSAQEAAEMWRVVGSLERVPAGEKAKLGEALLVELERGRAPDAGLWAMGRIGARVPLYGPIENVVNRHKAEKWVDRLLALDWSTGTRELAFATAEIARASGDRGRDLDEAVRQKVAARLQTVDDGARLAKLVLEPTALEAREERAAFGEALPAGLRLTSTEGRSDED